MEALAAYQMIPTRPLRVQRDAPPFGPRLSDVETAVSCTMSSSNDIMFDPQVGQRPVIGAMGMLAFVALSPTCPATRRSTARRGILILRPTRAVGKSSTSPLRMAR